MIVYMAGGLGNQMFEYAYARTIQERTGVPLYLDCSELKFHGYEGRKYSLDKLNIRKENIRVRDNTLKYIYFKFMKKMISKIHSNLDDNRMSELFDRKGMVISTNTYKFYNHRIHSKTKYMYGNFQSWKYFEEINDLICNELRVIAGQTQQNTLIEKEIKSVNSVCVHIRRGDYVSDPAWKQLNICDYTYYIKGLKLVSELVSNPVFFIFSNSNDDIRWIKENYNFKGFEIKYVDIDNPDYEELRLMSACKHFIISNSTFSWWAQHLAENKEKIVVAPKIWNREEEADDLYEDGWLTISTEG